MDGNGLLTILTFFPLVGIAAILLLKPLKRESNNLIRQVAIATAALTFIISIVVLIQFNPDQPTLQLIDKADWIPTLGVSYFLAVDGLAILFVMLTSFISLLAIIASWSQVQTQVKQYYVFMLLLEIGMTGVFLAQDLFMFYIFWEFTQKM